ncbi:acyltransferase, partial [bacterium]|nr:acyltransferase [bacterium]
ESILGVHIGRGSKIGANSIISCTSGINEIGRGISIGDGSGFGEYCYFGCAGGVEIGDNVIAGQYVSFHSENHLVNFDSDSADFSGVNRSGIKVGNNCWIGAKATFLDGSKLGNNCVVAAGSVVRDEYPDNVIIAGVPAKIVKHIS